MMGIGAGALVLTGVLFVTIPTQFFPDTDSDFSRISIEMAPGTTIRQTEQKIDEVLALVKDEPEIDVALDPFPFGGGVTTLEALSKGVPVVALAGSRPLARQSLSVIVRSGLGDLIAPDADSYVQIAADAVGRILVPADPAPRQAPELEAAFRQLWEKRLGSSPA